MSSRTKFLFPLSALLLLAASAVGGTVLAQAPRARITMEQARARALQEVPGTVIEQELEREDGRSIYSFEIRASGARSGRIMEVNIDANDGHVVGVEDETHEDDDGEVDEGR